MSWRRRNDVGDNRWTEGLSRLEHLTREFQRELGKLQQVASELAEAEPAEEPRGEHAG